MVKRVRDLGAAHSGFSDWYWQRLSAVLLLVLLPLALASLWAVYWGVLDQSAFLDGFHSFIFRLLHTLLAVALLVHAYMGLKVIIEDYVHTGFRVVWIALVLILMGGLGVCWLALIWAWGG